MAISKPPYFVYMLERADKSIYTGITTDLARRLAEHKQGIGSHYTRAHGARKMLYSERFKTRGEALRREAEIKKWRRERKLGLITASR
jgi:putative endonuclease